jgi:hypothetical protein
MSPRSKIKGSSIEPQVRHMFIKGKSFREISRKVGVHDMTVAAYIKSEFPEMTAQEDKEYDVQLLAAQIQNTLKDVDSIRSILKDKAIALKEGSPRDLSDISRAFVATDKRLDEKMETLFKLTHQLESIKVELKQLNIYNSPEWHSVIALVTDIFQPTPDQKIKLAEGLLSLQSGSDGAGKEVGNGSG